MKPTNEQKERIITLVNTMLLRSQLGIDQVVARMQIDGCDITRNTFENRFTTRVHQKPNIPPQWFFSLVRAFTHHLLPEERCLPAEALELFQIARLPLETLSDLQEFFPGYDFTTILGKLLPLPTTIKKQPTNSADTFLTRPAYQSAAADTPVPDRLTPSLQQEEWGNAPDTSVVVDRKAELTQVTQWIVEERCRIIGIFGMIGIGKTLFTAHVARQLRNDFDRVYWVSLRSAPPLSQLLYECLQFFTGLNDKDLPTSITPLSELFFRQLRAERSLLVLDGYDSLGEAGDIAGTYRVGYESYAYWLRQLAELPHKSCIILTSTEKPLEFITIPNDSGPVRSLQLKGIGVDAIRSILEQRGLHGTPQEWQLLYRHYSGNPSAIILATEPIRELFDGDLATFLSSKVALFQTIRDLIDQQFARLSLLEREVLYWLTIEREAVDIETLQDNIGRTVPKLHLLETVRSLLRRSLIEQQSNRFTMPKLIQTYMGERLIELVVSEIRAGIPLMVSGLALMKTQIKEYLREAQMNEIIHPIITRLFRFADHDEIEGKLLGMLRALQDLPSHAGNYCAGNLFNLLVQLNTDLRGQDFSHLEIHHGDLRTANLQGANFSNCTFHTCRFWESFASIAAIAFDPTGTYVAAGMTTGELYLWSLEMWELRYCIPSHSDMIWTVAFSLDGALLATGSEDQTVCVWDVASGECLLRVAAHDGWVKSVCFLHNNSQLATAGHDGKIRMWDITTGECIKSWQAHDSWVWSIAISPNDQYLASAGQDHRVKIWEMKAFTCLHELALHTEPVRTVAFSPDGQTLLSAGFDRVIALWEIATLQCRHLLRGHENFIWSAAFSPDGKEIVSGGDDPRIFVWDTTTGQLQHTIQGHQNRLWAVAFHPDGNILASGGDDQRLRFWNSKDGQPLHYIEGYSNQIWAIAHHHKHEQQIVAGGDDGTVRIWDYHTGDCIQLLQGHSERIRGVAFSPDGAYLATGSDDHTVRIWDTQRNISIHTLQGHQNRVWSVSYDAQGKHLISCSEDQTIRIWDTESGKLIRSLYMESGRIWSIAGHPSQDLLISSGDGHEILLWDIASGQCISAWEGHTARVWALCFNHNGSLVASGGADHTVCIWDTTTGTIRHRLIGHSNAVWTVAFSPSGRYLASGGDDSQIRVWDVENGKLSYEFDGHEGCIWSLTFVEETILASGGQDETIRLWHIDKTDVPQILRSERPYERMDITGVQGLTEAQKMSLRSLGALERHPGRIPAADRADTR